MEQEYSLDYNDPYLNLCTDLVMNVMMEIQETQNNKI